MTTADAVSGASPTTRHGYAEPQQQVGFFTDTTLCIGCKACEVACKEWNHVPEDGLNFMGMSYDNSGGLGADTWRHVKFIEQEAALGHQEPALDTAPRDLVDLGMPSLDRPGDRLGPAGASDFRWLMMSDVCKHCSEAACLDVCPTGALFRTEFDTVVVQEDICNGCGYCIPACPFGVIDQRKDDGRAWKCTLCYDRLSEGLEPACAKTCPTKSIQFGPLDDLREHAAQRVEQLHEAGVTSARLYGDSPNDGVGGMHAFFLLLDDPEVYGLPPDPKVTTRDLPETYLAVGVAAVVAAAVGVWSFLGTGGPR